MRFRYLLKRHLILDSPFLLIPLLLLDQWSFVKDLFPLGCLFHRFSVMKTVADVSTRILFDRTRRRLKMMLQA
jgi:hypothetical protein